MLFLTLLTLFQSFKQYSYNKQFINYFNGYYLPLHFYYTLTGNPGVLQQFQRVIGCIYCLCWRVRWCIMA